MKGKWKRLAALELVAAAMLTLVITAATADNEGEANQEPGIILLANVVDLTVYVDGEFSEKLTWIDMPVGQINLLKAPELEGKTFSRWAIGAADGPTASTQNPYRVAVNADLTLYAVYDDDTLDEPVIVFTAAVKQENMGADAIGLTATYSLPADYEAMSMGIRYTDNRLLGVDDTERDLTADAEKIADLDVEAMLKSEEDRVGIHVSSGDRESIGGDWTLLLSTSDDTSRVYAVAYVEYMVPGGETKTAYSELLNTRRADLDEVRIAVNLSDTFYLPDPPAT